MAMVETRMEAKDAVVRLKSMLDHGNTTSGSRGRLYLVHSICLHLLSFSQRLLTMSLTFSICNV